MSKAATETVVQDVESEVGPNKDQLIQMLSYKRPARSDSEAVWIDTFIRPVGRQEGAKMFTDPYGNIWIYVGQSTTMFSCHTDSVHRIAGRQELYMDEAKGEIFKQDKEPLGADDAAGAFVMLYMIEQGVPGVYVFHRDEEIGGRGSSWIADNWADRLEPIKRAVAFDRKGGTDVITHQAVGRCCSDSFAQALCDQLNQAEDSFMYMPSDGGVFTDTANYTHVVPECTNISVGYANEHTQNETLKVQHVLDLAKACCKVKWEELPVERDPSAFGGFESWSESWSGGSYASSKSERPAHRDALGELLDDWAQLTFQEQMSVLRSTEGQARLIGALAEVVISDPDAAYSLLDTLYEASSGHP